MRAVKAGEFKAKCLKLIDEVAATGEPVVVTKRGIPKVWVVLPQDAVVRRVDVDSIFGALRGLVTITGDPDDLVGPIVPEEEWDHLKDDWSPFPAE